MTENEENQSRMRQAEENPKSEARNSKQVGMTEMVRNQKPYDLEERTFQFAQRVRTFVKRLPRTVCNIEDTAQLVDASGSVGANYIEANESLGRKDFLMHIRISRKEAKESRYWLRLVDTRSVGELDSERAWLVQESTELMNIFGSIVRRCNGRDKDV